MNGTATGGRILVVGINYSPETTGIAPYTTALANSLVTAGYRVRVLTGVPHYPQWEVLDPRYRSGRRWHEQVGRVPVTRLAHAVPAGANLTGRLRMEAGFGLRAMRETARLPSDAIIAVTPSLSGAAAAILAARGRPVGVVVQDLTGAGASQSGTTGRAVGAAITLAELSMLRRATLVGVITPRFGEVLSEQGVAAERIVELPNFTHVEAVDADQEHARALLGWPPGGTLVVHTGNMGMKQGLESVVVAARMAQESGSDVTFVLVGDGNQRTELERQARGINRLRFVDPVDTGTYPYVLAAADVLLLNEKPGVLEMSMPSKLTSYVSARRPILAAVDRGGITHGVLAEEDAAELIAPGQPEALLATVQRLVADGDRRAELVAAAAAMGARRYDREAAACRYQAFAARLLDA